MSRKTTIRELAAEITKGLLSVAPGIGVLTKILPDTSSKAVRALFGVKQARSLEDTITDVREAITDELLGTLNAQPSTHEYGAVFSAIEDFKVALSETHLDSELVLLSLIDPETLPQRLRANCPAEHRQWASDLRHGTFERVLARFSSAIIAIAPQVPSVQTAIAIETYRLIAKQSGAICGTSSPKPS